MRALQFIRGNAISLLALFVALGGTGYAAATINGKNIKNGSIAGKKLKKHTLTGNQINLSKLGKVSSASSADVAANANALGGAPAANYFKAGCGAGKVNGYATIHGGATGFPNTYTSSPAFVDTTFNCSGQAVQVRRASTGVYLIRFPGNPGTIAFPSVHGCVGLCIVQPEPGATATFATFGLDIGSFAVHVQQSGSSTPVDDDVDILIP